MTPGERIVALRAERHLTRAELARRLQMPYNTLAGYERGEREPGHEFLVAISRIFNVSVDYLVGLSDMEPSVEDIPARLPPSEEALLSMFRSIPESEQERLLHTIEFYLRQAGLLPDGDDPAKR